MVNYFIISIVGWLLSQSILTISRVYTPGIANQRWFSIIFCSLCTQLRQIHHFSLQTLKRKFINIRFLMMFILSSFAIGIIEAVTCSPLHFIVITVFCSTLIILSIIDWNFYLLPDVLVFFVLWLGLLCSPALTPVTYQDRIVGACVGYLFLNLLNHIFHAITSKRGIGQGDMKLLAALGAWCGWQQLPYVTLLACCMALFYYRIGFQTVRRSQRNHLIPFGSFLSFSGITLILLDIGLLHH